MNLLNHLGATLAVARTSLRDPSMMAGMSYIEQHVK